MGAPILSVSRGYEQGKQTGADVAISYKKFHIPPILKNPIVEIHASTISLHHHNKVNPTPMKTMGVRQVHRGEQSISSIQAQLMCSAMLTNQICGPCWILGVLSTMSAKRFLAENCKTPNYGCCLLSLEDVLENAYILPLKAKQEGVVFLLPLGGGPACKVKETSLLTCCNQRTSMR